MADVFISYAREDSARASSIADALEAEGFSVFRDTEIPAGQTWADYIETKLKNSAAVLVLWSGRSIQSQWVREEARLGRDAGKLIPVQLDASLPPFGFGEVQAADLQTWAGDRADADWRRLVAAIRFAIDKNGKTPPQPQPQSQPTPRPPPAAPPAAQTASPSPMIPKAGSAFPSEIKPIWLIASGALGLLGLVIVLLLANAPQPPQGGAPGDGAAYAQAETNLAGLSAAVEQVVTQALEAEAAATAAATEAASHYERGAAAANAAFAGQYGFGSQRMPDGTLVAGELAAMMAGQWAAVGVASPLGVQFYGLYQQNTPTDYAMSGRAAAGTVVEDGAWSYSAASYRFSGTGSAQGRYVVTGQTQGPANGTGGAGMGVITYADGSRYVGEFRSVGSQDQGRYLKEGRGALYSPTGALIEAGRFANDAWAGEE
jgi:hypothetical protein